jgi:hypothetical protein
MLSFTIRNAVIVSLFQIGVIIFDALAAGSSRNTSGKAPLPLPKVALLDCGVLLLTVPLVWVPATLWFLLLADISERTKSFAFASDLVLLMLLMASMGYAIAFPWLNVDWSLGGARNTC